MATAWGKRSSLEFGELASKIDGIMKSLASVRDESLIKTNWNGDDKVEFVQWCTDIGLPALDACHKQLQGLGGTFASNANQQAQASARATG
jgi:hypothetical protein